MSAVTHRQLAPPQQAGVPPRAGSRLGAPAGMVGFAGEDSMAAGTPGGLSTRPSEQSLQGMAVGVGGCAAAADSAGIPYQTVERRRLVLDAVDSPAAGVVTAAGQRRQQQLTAGGSGEGEGSLRGGAAAALSLEVPPTEDDASRGAGSSGLLAAPSNAGSLQYAASVDLINAPIQDMEAEEAEVLS